MAFFESYNDLWKRMSPAWDRGKVDYKQAPTGQKPLIAAGGVGAGVVGLVGWSVPKTVGVAAYEYLDHSFGRSRGKTSFEYFAASPIFHTALMGVVAWGAGMALDFEIPWLGNNFLSGASLYLGGYAARWFPNVVSPVVQGIAGRGMSFVRRHLGHANAAVPTHDCVDCVPPFRLRGAPVG